MVYLIYSSGFGSHKGIVVRFSAFIAVTLPQYSTHDRRYITYPCRNGDPDAGG